MLKHQRVLALLRLLLLLNTSGSATKFNILSRGRNPEPQEGNVRLFGGSVSHGRVEIYHNGKWGTVCDDGWDMAEAQVVCRQLQFTGAKSVVIGKDYGKASGPIWLDDLTCKGTENYLTSCAFSSWGETDCRHKEDVGVICESIHMGSNVTMSDSPHLLDHSISLSDERGQLFDSGNDCDFTISVRSEIGDRQEEGDSDVVETICAHKLILSQFPLFNASEGSTGITISQACQSYVTPFIRYIYTRKLDVTFSSAQCLHWLAYSFGVQQLMEDTGRLFTRILTEDDSFHTQVSLYNYAEETNDLVLQENCVQYLAWNYQNLTTSPAWTHLSVNLLRSILTRSDMVVPNEYFVLQTVEDWIMEKWNSTSLKSQVDLLSCIRFPMIPVEKLYSLESISSLYSIHEVMYRKNIMKAYQFNILLFSNLVSSPKFDRQDADYQPRIYTAEPWGIAVKPAADMRYNPYNQYNQYNQARVMWLTTPVHTSLLFKNSMIRWQANVFTRQHECSNIGLRCESLPAARLVPQNKPSELRHIVFHNRLLMTCQGKFICQVQDFKDNMAVNGTQDLKYPCPDNQYTYHFVVRPEYI